MNLPLMLLLALSFNQDHVERDHHEMGHLHRDSDSYIAMLEDPSRDAYQKPGLVIESLNLKEGEILADIGAGSGYFSLRFAQYVGEQGKVFAVDINPDMIRHMNRRIRDLGLSNVTTVLAEEDDPLLRERSVDRFFICDTWHHINDQEAYLSLMRKALKPNGQIVMVDFKKVKLPVGPPLGMKIAKGDLIQQMKDSGFLLTQEHTFLPYQYFLVFEPE
jgi:ubiquinone/menaquinone biosynthesis C-methylase UbiE